MYTGLNTLKLTMQRAAKVAILLRSKIFEMKKYFLEKQCIPRTGPSKSRFREFDESLRQCHPESIETVKYTYAPTPPPPPHLVLLAPRENFPWHQSHKHWVLGNNKITARIRHGLDSWMRSAKFLVIYRLLHFNFKLLSREAHLSSIWRAFGELMFPWCRRDGGGGGGGPLWQILSF